MHRTESYLDNTPHLWGIGRDAFELAGQHIRMIVGKVQFMKLFGDKAQQRGDEFNLKEFMDEFLAAGMIPFSLIRWEMTSHDDEIRKLW